jgi:hypothetical protein
LIQATALVQIRSTSLQEELVHAMTEDAWEVMPWRHSLAQLMDVLDGIADAAMEARAVCSQLSDQADRDHEAAQRAALALLRRDAA